MLVGAEVTSVDQGCVMLSDRRIGARTVLWAAGVAASPLARSLGVPLDRAGRVMVREDLSIPGHPEVFVVGDLAAVRRSDGSMIPGVAPAAIQQGRHAANNVERLLRGAPTLPFRYVDKGSLAAIGRGSAVAERGRVRLRGPIAWLMWLFVHILFLIGFRNRASVLATWAWEYVRRMRGSRLILGEVGPLLEWSPPRTSGAR